ncbi:tetratricopeptide repeat protein, partial [Candidatus Zixiibacteriota bacterium]
MAKGRRNSHMARLHKKLQTEPTSRVFARLADAFRLSEHIEDAIELCHKGLESHPDLVSGHIVLGQCYLDQGDLGPAQEAFSRALSLDSNNLLVLKSLGDILFRKGEVAQAVEHYRRILELDPRNGEIREVVRELEVELGLSSVEELAAQSPFEVLGQPAVTEVPVFGNMDLEPGETREWLLGDEDDKEPAELEAQLSPEETELLENGTDERSDKGPPRGMATSTLAEVYFQQGLLDKAIETFQKVLRHDPDDQQARIRLEDLRALRSAKQKNGSQDAEMSREFVQEMGIMVKSE